MDMGMQMGKTALQKKACYWKAKVSSFTTPDRFYRDRLIAGSRDGTWLLPGVSILFRMPGFLIPE